MRIVALAETFAGSRLRSGQAVYMGVVGNTLTVWEGILNRADRTWVNREQVWGREFGVELLDCPDYAPFRGFVEARNAVTHGLGYLTDQQLSRLSEVESYLKAANVELDGRRVLFGDRHVEAASYIAIGLVRWLDFTAPF